MTHRTNRWLPTFLQRGNRRTAGIDLGTESIKIASAHGDWAHPQLDCIAAPAPPDILDGQRLRSPEAVGVALRELLDREGWKVRRAAIALPAPSIVVKRLSVPPTPRGEQSEAIAAEIERAFPGSHDELVLDYQVLATDPAGRLEVVAAAARREVAETYAAAVTAAKLEPIVIDCECFALQSAAELCLPSPEGSVALIHVGRSYVSLHVTAAGISRFTVELAVRGHHAPATAEGGAADPNPWTGLAEEIHHHLHFYCPFLSEIPLQEAILTGGCAADESLQAALGHRLQVPLRVFSVADADGQTVVGPEFAVAAGLALRAASE